MYKLKLLLFIFLFDFSVLHAQVGGSSVYSFLNVPASARIAAMGGTFISVKDNDLNMGLQNPSVLNPTMSNNLLLNGVVYFDGVKFGDAAYAKDYKEVGTFMANMHFASYGSMPETDITGEQTGTFNASDFNLNIGWGKSLNELFSIGANLKTVYSNYYLNQAFGIGADIAGTLYDSSAQFTAAIVARNIGVQLKNYVNGDNEPWPIEVDAALSKRLLHTPLRFNFTYTHCEKFDLAYTDPNDNSTVDPLTGETQVTTYGFFNTLSRHVILGAEILISKNFHLRTAYNFQRRQELTIDESSGTVGLSWGFGIKISKFIISYGSASYHLAGSANHFSIATNLSDFIKK